MKSLLDKLEALKPCPFCGGDVKLERTLKRDSWGVVCRNTLNLGGTCAIEQIPSKSKEAAITRWNMRAIINEAKEEAQGIPEGYALVPLEPTEEMLKAGCETGLDINTLMDDAIFSTDKAVYKAMINQFLNK